MQVFTFECTEADVPDGRRFMALIWCEFTGKGGKPVMDWSPVRFRGDSAEAVKAKATAFWNDQIEAEKAKKANAEKRAAARKAALLQATGGENGR